MLVVGFRSAQVTHKNGAEISNDFDRIHEALRGVLRLIPSGLSFMVPILTEHFPHKSEDLHANVWYMKNMMRVVEYAPVLMKPMWGLAVDRILQIDVEIKTALDDLDDDEHKEVLEHCFDPDAPDLYQKSLYLEGKKEHYSESDSDSDDLNLDDDSDSDSDSEPPPIVHDFAKLTGKLDSMLNVLMGYVKDTLTSPTLRPAQRDAFHNLLAEIFERSVLPTHRSFAETFLVLLAQKTFDTSAPSIIRISASAYLASFVARASFLDVTSVLYCVRMFNNWAVNYVETNELEAEGPDVSRFGVFYAIVQATLYVFCFRWMEIVGAANSGVANGKLPVEMNGFQKVLSSRFAPLLVCSKYVVKEFAKITHRLDILYVYTLMQRSGSDRTQPRTTQLPHFTPRTLGSPTRNSMMAISPSPSSPWFMQASECLEAFFPFDPCLLRLTGASWRPLCGMARDDGDDGDEEDEGRSARSAESDIEFMSTSMDA
ncbi:RNA polymerase I-specific transcription initiation factor RRN3 [Chytridium lagenaria]|nr:RNA polymerase I-specific transcription initiation factor RRN3 [Chytridium lagenaria]